MAGRPRKPDALQVASGRDKQNPGRYRDRKKNAPTGLSALGDPPAYIVDNPDNLARSAWRTFEIELPWLTESDRGYVEVVSLVRGEIMAGVIPGVQKLSMYRSMLGQLGATPADKSKVSTGAGDDDEKEDSEDIFNEG